MVVIKTFSMSRSSALSHSQRIDTRWREDCDTLAGTDELDTVPRKTHRTSMTWQTRTRWREAARWCGYETETSERSHGCCTARRVSAVLRPVKTDFSLRSWRTDHSLEFEDHSLDFQDHSLEFDVWSSPRQPCSWDALWLLSRSLSHPTVALPISSTFHKIIIIIYKKAVLSQGNRAMPQLFFSV